MIKTILKRYDRYQEPSPQTCGCRSHLHFSWSEHQALARARARHAHADRARLFQLPLASERTHSVATRFRYDVLSLLRITAAVVNLAGDHFLDYLDPARRRSLALSGVLRGCGPHVGDAYQVRLYTSTRTTGSTSYDITYTRIPSLLLSGARTTFPFQSSYWTSGWSAGQSLGQDPTQYAAYIAAATEALFQSFNNLPGA